MSGASSAIVENIATLNSARAVLAIQTRPIGMAAFGHNKSVGGDDPSRKQAATPRGATLGTFSDNTGRVYSVPDFRI